MRLLYLLASVILFGSCRLFNCSNRPCDPLEPVATLRLVDGATGADLLFGDSARYRPGELRAYYIQENVAGDIPLFFGTLPSGGDSAVHLNGSASRIVYLQLSATDTDTLELSLQSSGGDCCPGSFVSGLRYNGAEAGLIGPSTFRLQKN